MCVSEWSNIYLYVSHCQWAPTVKNTDTAALSSSCAYCVRSEFSKRSPLSGEPWRVFEGSIHLTLSSVTHIWIGMSIWSAKIKHPDNSSFSIIEAPGPWSNVHFPFYRDIPVNLWKQIVDLSSLMMMPLAVKSLSGFNVISRHRQNGNIDPDSEFSGFFAVSEFVGTYPESQLLGFWVVKAYHI